VFVTPRATAVSLACATAVVLVAGCGAQEHVNDPRPQPPTRVSVAINQEEVIVDPGRIAVGPEPDQQIPQNQNTSQPQIRSNAPIDVVLVAANLTDLDSRLLVRGSGKDATSQMLVANGNISLQTALPTGIYTVSAAGIPSAEPARLVVGPLRTSSENDLLLP
jgi:hypothetical protein